MHADLSHSVLVGGLPDDHPENQRDYVGLAGRQFFGQDEPTRAPCDAHRMRHPVSGVVGVVTTIFPCRTPLFANERPRSDSIRRWIRANVEPPGGRGRRKWRGPGVRILSSASVLQHRVARGTIPRARRFARPYRSRMVLLLGILTVDAVVGASIPLFFRGIIDNGITPHDKTVIIALSCGLAVVALADQVLGVAGTFVSARIGQGILFDLSPAVYRHVQQLPIAFFTRTDTGALMSRLDNDVNGAQQAFGDLFTVVTGSTLTLIISVIVMFTLSWQFTLLALVALPLGGLVARLASRRVAGL